MNNVKISILGSDGYVCQIPRIKEGIETLGHIISKDSPDIIYANDPRGYEEALKLKKKYPSSYLIFNLLDVPWHMPNIKKQTELLVEHYLQKADAVTTISNKVKKDLAEFYNKKIHVIYNPIKDVYLDEKIKKNNTFFYVGRAKDPIKRFELVKESLSIVKNGEKNLKVCGVEDPKFGNYLGVIKDEKLNEIYNSSKYVLLPSKAEGLGLPMIEAMICGSIPITCSDNLTAKEFLATEFICDPNSQSIINQIKKLEENYEEKRKLAIEFGKKYKVQFDKKNIAKNIIDVFHAK